MKVSTHLAALAALGLLTFAPAANAQAAQYSIFNVTGGLSNAISPYGNRVNASGQVVGYSRESAFVTGANGGNASYVSPSSDYFPTQIYDINDAGQFTGVVQRRADFAVFALRGAVDAGGSQSALEYLAPPTGEDRVSGKGINNVGQLGVTGSHQIGNNEISSVYRTSAIGTALSYTALGTLNNSPNNGVTGINASGEVAGDSGRQAFRSSKNGAAPSLTGLGFLSGGTESFGSGINASGQVAGYGDDASGNYRAFVSSKTGDALSLTNLGLYAGLSESDSSDVEAYGIDTAGDVVGAVYLDGIRQYRAFYYSASAGKMFSLNDLIDPASGWILEDAYGINDLGQITGDGLYNGVRQAFLITPNAAATPEPGSIALLVGMGITGVGVLRRRRK